MAATSARHLTLVSSLPSWPPSGEQLLQQRLLELTSTGVKLLHSRRTPTGSGIIDHIAVAPSGIWVLESLSHQARPRRTKSSNGDEKLFLGRRDATRMIAGTRSRLDEVRSVVHPSIPVTGILCFTDADWPLIGGSFTVDEIRVAWPKKACDLILAGRRLNAPQIAALHERLDDVLPTRLSKAELRVTAPPVRLRVAVASG
jgi:hypothetical protein